MLKRHLSQGNRKKARRARFAHENVVSGLAELSLLRGIPDRKQPSVFIVKRRKIRFPYQIGKRGDDGQERGRFPHVFLRPLAKGNQRGDEISAVHRRNEAPAQYGKRFQIIPIIKVSVPFAELLQAFRRRPCAKQKLLPSDQTEISRRQQGKQVHTDIRGRGTHGNGIGGRKLHVIGRQKMRFFTHVIAEIAPRVTDIGKQLLAVVSFQPYGFFPFP